jgi:hypothetical protein
VLHTNDDAWVKVPLWGLLGYGLALLVVVPLTEGSPAGVAGRLLIPLVVATGFVVIVATSWKREWTWRTYAATAPAAVAVLTAALALVVSLDPAVDRQVATAAPVPVSALGPAAPATTSPAVTERQSPQAFPTFTAHLGAPDAGANWVKLTDPAIVAQDAQLAGWAAGLYAIDDVVAGTYEHQLMPGSPFRYIGVNGHIAADSREAAGRAALVSTFGNRVATFPPRADGWLGCNGGQAQGSSAISCAWVGEDAAVFLRWDDTGIKLGQAASTTRAFRDFVAGG